ncbi:transmembrane emp24 domain-containing protein 7-like [Clavelina lepadiformis]|uniref:transmembrane emp24 domain-containing protein 7-like n=1 Tax=Clavelina lepadiformis TaxID=159417 RepID=UPI0040416029
MNFSQQFVILLLHLILLFTNILGMELTFELEDNTKQCFFHDIKKDTKAFLEYQVVSGGKYDVDCSVEDPDELKLYSEKRKQFDVYEWDAQKDGPYKICFGNEFSTISHKIVYFDLTVGNEALLLDTMDRSTALTQMESYCVTIHDRLKEVFNLQTHFRLREAQGRVFAESLSTRVQVWSCIQLFIIITAMVGQVFILRSFFANKHAPMRRTTT